MRLRKILAAAPAAAMLLAAPPARALDHRQLAVIVNTADPLSVEIGEYYAKRRRITFQNFIKVSFPPGQAALSREEFESIKAQADAQVLPHVQAFALTWAAPYRVECMSITAAFAFGFDAALCAAGCRPTRASPYFNSPSRQPFTQLGLRPAMAIAATSFERAKELIDRGVQADGTRPKGTAYLLSTSDNARNVRSASYPVAARVAKGRLAVKILRQDAISARSDVLIYLTGLARVDGLRSIRFLPGAIGDHLTSAGGILTDSDSGQMSALRWLEAGATGSYGTVVEPCNLPQKFPHPGVLIERYLAGDTLIEAYWKSVRMPGQGIFVGEPLAAPFYPAVVSPN
jgi:uncharacterized protein (TIGR03790 family)